VREVDGFGRVGARLRHSVSVINLVKFEYIDQREEGLQSVLCVQLAAGNEEPAEAAN
jgi:hypothetical protein